MAQAWAETSLRLIKRINKIVFVVTGDPSNVYNLKTLPFSQADGLLFERHGFVPSSLLT